MKRSALPIGARSVGASKSLAQVELKAEATKDCGAIVGTVIGENPADRNAELGIVIDRSLEPGGRRRGFLVGQDLREGDAGVIIDGDVNIFPTGAVDTATTMARSATTDGLEAARFS